MRPELLQVKGTYIHTTTTQPGGRKKKKKKKRRLGRRMEPVQS
jgi:hypothetical protein